MSKMFLTVTVAALAIAAPAQAERDRGDRGQRAERAQKVQDQRAERRQRATERRAPRQQQVSDRRASRQQQVSDRRASRQQQVSDRRASRQQQISDRRASHQQQVSDRRSRIEQQVSDRRARAQQIASDRRGRAEQIRSDRRGLGPQEVSDRRARVQQIASDRRSRIEQRASDRRGRIQQLESDRRSRIQQAQSDGLSRIQQDRSDRRALTQRFEFDDQTSAGERREWRQQVWRQRADRIRVLAERRDRLRERWDDDDRDDRRKFRSLFRAGDRVNRDWWYDDYVPVRYASRFIDDDDFYYRYDGDYIYRLRRDDDIVLSLFPLLGGAYSVGNLLPFYQTSYYNVPYGYSSLYYDTPDSYYRYGDGGIYQVDPTTQLIAGIVALLTGQNLGIGQRLPLGYDTYNVPYAYRSTYYDTDDMWYRYDDGYIYGVDPRSRLIQSSYPVYGGYGVGQAWPSYAGYDYDVPGYYDDLYYAEPGYDYRFASGGIYQVDPETQLIAGLVALVTGQNFAVGQPMPLGYDAYNVPFAYRDRYYDDEYLYRYADGHIYEVDPESRLIRRIIDLA